MGPYQSNVGGEAHRRWVRCGRYSWSPPSSRRCGWMWCLRLYRGRGFGRRKLAAAVSSGRTLHPSLSAPVSRCRRRLAAASTFFTRGREEQDGGVPLRFARERFHEVEGMNRIPVCSTGFGVDLDGVRPRPGLTERVYKGGRERNPVGAKPRGSAGIGTQSRRGRG